MIDCVVAPVDQRLPVGLLLVSVTLPPGQNCTGPLAVITGAGGLGLMETETMAEVSDTQFPSLTRTQ